MVCFYPRQLSRALQPVAPWQSLKDPLDTAVCFQASPQPLCISNCGKLGRGTRLWGCLGLIYTSASALGLPSPHCRKQGLKVIPCLVTGRWMAGVFPALRGI